MLPQHEIVSSTDPQEITKGRLWKVTSRYGKENFVFFNAYSADWMQQSMSYELSQAMRGNNIISHMHDDKAIVDKHLSESDGFSGILLAIGVSGLKYLHVTNRLHPFWFTYANVVEPKSLHDERKKLDKELSSKFSKGEVLECLDFRHNHPDTSLQKYLQYYRFKIERVYETPDVFTLYRPLWQVGLGCAFISRVLPKVGGLFAPVAVVSCGLATALAQDTIMTNKPPHMPFLYAAKRSMEYSYARIKSDWEGNSSIQSKLKP